MKGHRHHQTPILELDHTVVVKDEITGGSPNRSGLGPRCRLIGGKLHHWPAIQQVVLHEVKQGDGPAVQPEQRHAHHVCPGLVLND